MNNNQPLMHLIRKVHGFIENEDTVKYRQSQDSIGALLSSGKNFKFIEVMVNNMHAEWTKYVHNTSTRNIIFYCHGGGYMTGSCLYARTITSKLAQETQCDVFCFDYSLAPEHPYPAAINDALDFWNYILSQGYRAPNIIIAGDSAGGNMALSLTLCLKNARQPMPKCLILFSPWTDMTSSGKSYLTKANVDPVLTPEYIAKAIESYAPGMDVSLPQLSPVNGNLENFPPVYIQAGDNEILLDDSNKLYKRLLECNVYAKLDIFNGMWHVFQMSPLRTADIAISKVSSFISKL